MEEYSTFKDASQWGNGFSKNRTCRELSVRVVTGHHRLPLTWEIVLPFKTGEGNRFREGL